LNSASAVNASSAYKGRPCAVREEQNYQREEHLNLNMLNKGRCGRGERQPRRAGVSQGAGKGWRASHRPRADAERGGGDQDWPLPRSRHRAHTLRDACASWCVCFAHRGACVFVHREACVSVHRGAPHRGHERVVEGEEEPRPPDRRELLHPELANLRGADTPRPECRHRLAGFMTVVNALSLLEIGSCFEK
jgi:hypothetical protein